MLTTNQSQHQSSSSTSTSSTSSRVAKSSQRILTSSSSSEMKASSMKSDLTELKRGISEMKNISTNFSQRLRSSMENLVDRLVSRIVWSNFPCPLLIKIGPLRRLSERLNSDVWWIALWTVEFRALKFEFSKEWREHVTRVSFRKDDTRFCQIFAYEWSSRVLFLEHPWVYQHGLISPCDVFQCFSHYF